MLRVGVPRALHGLQHYPLWRTFLEDLGLQVVISPPSNREMLASGARLVADVTCLPVKMYAGHVMWLRDQGAVDLVLVPAIRSFEKGALHCSKFMGLPDLIHAVVVDCPPLLDMEIDAHRYEISPRDAFERLGRRFTRDARKIKSAWEHACQVDDSYRARMIAERLTYPEALARLYPDEWTAAPVPPDRPAGLEIGLVGHPYCLHDDYVNHNLIARIRALGVRVRTSEMVSPADAEAGICKTTGQTRWFYEKWMSGAAGHYLGDSGVDGVIAVMAFACGPDSAMVETMTRRAHAWQRPFMTLVLDEHGSAAGMVTRLEAFVDMLTRQRVLPRPVEAVAIERRPASPAESPTASSTSAPVVLKLAKVPTVGFPRMGTCAVPIKSLFEDIGVRVELGPSLSSRTISLGARYSPEFICTPFKYIVGNMIEMLDAGADTLVYMDGAELCRNSSYTQLMNDVLHDLGYKFNLVSTSCFEKGGLLALPQFLRQFMPEFSWSRVLRAMQLALAKMTALDDMERRVQYTRPRQVAQGAVDKIWDEALVRVDQVRTVDLLRQVKADVLQKIDRVEIDPALEPVKIATTGEYYAVLEPFYNLNIERILGQLGAHVSRSLMLGDWVKLAMIWEALGFHKSDIDQAAKPYVRWNIGGEGLMTVGQTVLHARKGFAGIVELLPFTCLPEITALNILPRVSRDLNIPIISFILDEQSGQAGVKTRLEAFVDLLYRRREMQAGRP